MIQEHLLCTGCGAEIPSDARFCRRCGQASMRLSQESVTEGTTRILETPERKNNPFGPANSYEQYEQPGGLAQATNRMPPQVNPTSRSLEAEKKRPNWLLIGSMTVAVLALITVVILLSTRNSTKTITVRTGTTATGLPQIPDPPSPPPVPGSNGSTTIDSALMYPGAKPTMSVSGNGDGDGDGDEKGSVLQLQTKDSFDKVVEWYNEKLQPDFKKTDPDGRHAILASKAKKLSAIINDGGSEGVSILLAQGGK